MISDKSLLLRSSLKVFSPRAWARRPARFRGSDGRALSNLPPEIYPIAYHQRRAFAHAALFGAGATRASTEQIACAAAGGYDAPCKQRRKEAERMTDSTRDVKREMLRHTLATLAYRGGKTRRGFPARARSRSPARATTRPSRRRRSSTACCSTYCASLRSSHC